MKKLFFVLLIGMTCVLGAAEGPFKKGTTYLNFNLCFIGTPWNKIGNPDIFGIFALGNPSLGKDKLIIDENQGFGCMATGMTLEYGITADLGLTFQYYERSGDWEGIGIDLAKQEEYEYIAQDGPNKGNVEKFTSAYIDLGLLYNPGRFRERVLAVGGNYHLNFIGMQRLDVYTGFQLGIEGKSYFVHSRLGEQLRIKFPAEGREIWLVPINAEGSMVLIYAHITAGFNYFITDKIAINLRSGLKLGTSGYESVFFYGGGLTLKL